MWIFSIAGAALGFFLFQCLLAWRGLRVLFLGEGYLLFGNRESFGKGAKFAAALFCLPIPIEIAVLSICAANGLLTWQGVLERADVWGWSLFGAMAGTAFLCVVSYLTADFTYVPYWVYAREMEAAEPEEELDEETLRKKRRKFRHKQEKARRRLEEQQRLREEEERRLMEQQDEERRRRGY